MGPSSPTIRSEKGPPDHRLEAADRVPVGGLRREVDPQRGVLRRVGDGVGAGPAGERVDAVQADDHVVPRAAVERVDVAVAGEDVVAAAAGQVLDRRERVVLPDRPVVGGVVEAGADRLGPADVRDRVGPGAPVQHVGPEAAAEDVVPTAAEEALRAVAAEERVVPLRAEDLVEAGEGQDATGRGHRPGADGPGVGRADGHGPDELDDAAIAAGREGARGGRRLEAVAPAGCGAREGHLEALERRDRVEVHEVLDPRGAADVDGAEVGGTLDEDRLGVAVAEVDRDVEPRGGGLGAHADLLELVEVRTGDREARRRDRAADARRPDLQREVADVDLLEVGAVERDDRRAARARERRGGRGGGGHAEHADHPGRAERHPCAPAQRDRSRHPRGR
ncbi:hypothetical protein GKE82_09705 [Conexibacter sp. W3-3-2]|nr:hypothetical protein [Conexibacter sp. W3-3-2]MTD44556.1 hypothetical protein [Conexibacter sp. W3-3-2]